MHLFEKTLLLIACCIVYSSCGARQTPDERTSPGKTMESQQKSCLLGKPTGCMNTILVLAEGAVLPPEVLDSAGKTLAVDCEGGEAKSCFALGLLHHGGFGDPPDMLKSARSFFTGCEGGHAESCGMIGWMELRGQGTAWDPAAAWDHLELGCSDGGNRSCMLLGVALILGIAGIIDEKLGRKYVVSSCEGGLEEACTFLNDHLWEGAATASMHEGEKEMRHLDTQCRWGQVDACIEILALHESGALEIGDWVTHEFELLSCGLGWAPSCGEFMAWLEEAMAKGSGWPGYDTLAESHIKSLMGKQSDLVSGDWASRALGIAKAVLHGTDPDLPRDWRAARAMMALSCGGESYEACFWLGWMWREGIGGPGNESAATRFTDEAEKLRSAACSSEGGSACDFEFEPNAVTD